MKCIKTETTYSVNRRLDSSFAAVKGHRQSSDLTWARTRLSRYQNNQETGTSLKLDAPVNLMTSNQDFEVRHKAVARSLRIVHYVTTRRTTRNIVRLF